MTPDIKLTLLTERTEENKSYSDRMAKAVPRVKTDRPKSKAQDKYEESEQFPRTYEAYLQRPLPLTSWKANPHAKTTDEMVGMRRFDAKEVMVFESIRRQSKNTQGDFMSETIERSTERKAEGEQAFMHTPGISSSDLTEEQRQAIIALSEYTEPPQPTDEDPKKGLLTKFKEVFSLKYKKEINKSGLAYALYKASGGKDEDLE